MAARRDGAREAWRPDPIQELLLDACIGPAGEAAAAFAQWRRRCELEAVDAGSQRLLPLLVPRKSLFDPGDAAWPIIRGVYRRAFVHNQLLCRRGGEMLAALAARGLPALALKGAALMAYYDGNPALRPMNDFDLLVPRSRAREAIAVLAGAGWRTGWPQAERLPEVYHGAAFRPSDGLELDLDLHWAVLDSDDGAHDRALWDGAVPCMLPGVLPGLPPGVPPGVDVRAPRAEDLLVIVCAHAAAWVPLPPIRWVADAVRITTQTTQRAGALDWNRVVEAARAWHVTLQLADTLGYLATRWQVDVPAAALDALRRAPVAGVDRRAYAGLASRPRTAAYLMRPWRRYRLLSRSLPAWRALPGFVRYLEVTLGQPHWRALPAEILRRVLRFRRGRRGMAR